VTVIAAPETCRPRRVERGRHASPRFGTCVMELASLLAGEPFSDRPVTVSPVIGALLRTYNDGIDDERRQDLSELAPVIVGTAARRSVEENRASLCLQFAQRLGGAVPAGRAALGSASPEPSGALAALAALGRGPSDEVHAEVIALVDALALDGRRDRLGRLRPPGRGLGRLARRPRPSVRGR
jgi:hypothetical protein